QPVIAAAKQLRKPSGPLHRAPIEPEIGQFGSRHRADDHHLGDGAPFQGGEQLADLPHADPDVRIGFNRRIGRADDSDQERLSAGATGLARDLERKSARAAQDRQRTRGMSPRHTVRPAHPSSSFPARGTQIARSPPWRRKATICSTAAWPAKASATSSTRSFKVAPDAPPPLNSIL